MCAASPLRRPQSRCSPLLPAAFTANTARRLKSSFRVRPSQESEMVGQIFRKWLFVLVVPHTSRGQLPFGELGDKPAADWCNTSRPPTNLADITTTRYSYRRDDGTAMTHRRPSRRDLPSRTATSWFSRLSRSWTHWGGSGPYFSIIVV